MSAVAQTVYGYPTPQAANRPGLRAVINRAQAIPTSRARVVGAFVTFSVLMIILRMFIQVGNESVAYEIDRLNEQNISLGRDALFIQEQMNALNSPQELANRAIEMGMTNNLSVSYLRLSDGAIVGGSSAATDITLSDVAVDNVAAERLGTESTYSSVATSTGTDKAGQLTSTDATPSAQSGIPAPNSH
ncbi:MAG: hypothetical protein ACKOWN_04445 [Microbacteriaceae bacterium]